MSQRPVVKVNAMSFALMLEYLMDHPNSSYYELAECSGLHYVTVRDWIGEWRKLGIAHVSGWEPDSRGRYNVMLFSLGRGKNVKKPKKSGAVRAAEYRERKKVRALQAAVEGRAQHYEEAVLQT